MIKKSISRSYAFTFQKIIKFGVICLHSKGNWWRSFLFLSLSLLLSLEKRYGCESSSSTSPKISNNIFLHFTCTYQYISCIFLEIPYIYFTYIFLSIFSICISIYFIFIWKSKFDLYQIIFDSSNRTLSYFCTRWFGNFLKQSLSFSEEATLNQLKFLKSISLES